MKIENKFLLELISKGYISIKTSFEDEGAEFDDVLFLKGGCDRNDLALLLKIGGAEAIRDIKDANKLQIIKINGPMIESVFALEKFSKCINNYYSVEAGKIFINIETKQTIENLDEMLNSKWAKPLTGVTVGRGDLVQSYGFDRYGGHVDSDYILDITEKVFKTCRKKGLICTLGGSMSYNSKDFVNNLVDKQLLDYFETRNVIINCNALQEYEFDKLINAALQFELSYLQFKSNHHSAMIVYDKDRIKRLSKNIISSEI